MDRSARCAELGLGCQRSRAGEEGAVKVKVQIGKEEISYHDDEALRSHSMAYAIALVALVPGRKLRRELEALLADCHFFYLKAQGWLCFHDARSADMVPKADVQELVNYLRAVIGEPPVTNDSPVTKPPETPAIVIP